MGIYDYYTKKYVLFGSSYAVDKDRIPADLPKWEELVRMPLWTRTNIVFVHGRWDKVNSVITL